MKQLYLECRMGAAGDMLLAALCDLTENPEKFITRINALGLKGVCVKREPTSNHGISGTHLHVHVHGEEEGEHPHQTPVHHHGRSLADVETMIEQLSVSNTVRKNAVEIYRMIADAESSAHGKSVGEIHFHELGMMDAIVDIVGCCMAMEEIAADRICCSTISVGGGTVHTAHGELPVPAPATAKLLEGLPICGGPVEAELVTPTGAAVIKHFVQTFESFPAMSISKTTYGMGTREFDRANCVRAFLGNTSQNTANSEQIVALSCNLDDMTGESMAFALEKLLDEGALDAFYTPILMKKGRPAQMFTVLCRESDADKLAMEMLRHTTTLGVRKQLCQRYTLARSERIVNTVYGPIHLKEACGDGIHKVKPEYEDVAAVAKKHGVSLLQILDSVNENNKE